MNIRYIVLKTIMLFALHVPMIVQATDSEATVFTLPAYSQ